MNDVRNLVAVVGAMLLVLRTVSRGVFVSTRWAVLTAYRKYVRALTLFDTYQRTGRPELLDRSIALLRAAASPAAAEYPDRGAILNETPRVWSRL